MISNYSKLLWMTLLFAFYVAASCSGLYYLKDAHSWWSTKFFGGFVLYGLGAVIWLLILRILPLSTAFPVAAGALMIGTTVTGAILLNETVTVPHVAGMVLIAIGISLVGLATGHG